MELDSTHIAIGAGSGIVGGVISGIGALFHFGRRMGEMKALIEAQAGIIRHMHEEIETMRKESREDIHELRQLLAAKGNER